MNKPKAVGTAAETAVTRALHGLGFPHAERRALRGAHDAGDITGTPGICWEVKGGTAAKTASDNLVAQWLDDTERERRAAGAAVGVLVLQRSGIGGVNAHRWWAVVRWPILLSPTTLLGFPDGVVLRLYLSDLCLMLRRSGYGAPVDVDEGRVVTVHEADEDSDENGDAL